MIALLGLGLLVLEHIVFLSLLYSIAWVLGICIASAFWARGS
jgi:hypothetical protein